jgi:hypothetical protein
MLEKELGIHLPDKLHAILLMEADLNFPNKLFLGRRMIEQAEAYDEIPDKKSMPGKDIKQLKLVLTELSPLIYSNKMDPRIRCFAGCRTVL